MTHAVVDLAVHGLVDFETVGAGKDHTAIYSARLGQDQVEDYSLYC